MLWRFCLYGFLKNQRYFEPFLLLALLDRGLSFTAIGGLIACRDLTTNLLELPSGALADTGRRRLAMVASMLAYLVAYAVLGAAQGGWLILGMVALGVGDTFRTGTHKAMIFQWLRSQDRLAERTRVYGLTRSWSLLGSALSGLLGAAIVILTGDYDWIFWLALIPCAANLVNLATYPAELDGTPVAGPTLAATGRRLAQTLAKTWTRPGLRGLIAETMAWEGYLAAVKDYLQPVLQGVAVVLAAWWWGSQAATAETDAIRQSAWLIGPVYGVLFLVSAIASRQAHRVQDAAGDNRRAAGWLWRVQGGLFLLLALGAWSGLAALAATALMILSILKNLWRPILISRFDDYSDPDEGATILSIESQARRGATLILAPLAGWIMDQSWGGLEWIGLLGLGLAIAGAWAVRAEPAASGEASPDPESATG